MSDLTERLARGKQEANNVVPWWCSRGHELAIHPDVLEATCHCGRVLRRKDLYPNWHRKAANR